MRTRQEQFCISAVIPALNAAGTLPATLAALAPAAAVGEVIVADGGSGDETVAVARKAGASVILGAHGRGPQLAAGAEAATGAWLLFVHADSRPEPGWEAAVSAFIAEPKAACRAGYFRFALDDQRAAARRVERAVAWRCRAMALPYGDQGLLISRPLYDEVGGYRPLPLMEDVDLVRRLGRRRLQPIPARMITSARRYRTDGYLHRPLRNLVCLSLYFAGVPPAFIARLYR